MFRTIIRVSTNLYSDIGSSQVNARGPRRIYKCAVPESNRALSLNAFEMWPTYNFVSMLLFWKHFQFRELLFKRSSVPNVLDQAINRYFITALILGPPLRPQIWSKSLIGRGNPQKGHGIWCCFVLWALLFMGLIFLCYCGHNSMDPYTPEDATGWWSVGILRRVSATQ